MPCPLFATPPLRHVRSQVAPDIDVASATEQVVESLGAVCLNAMAPAAASQVGVLPVCMLDDEHVRSAMESYASLLPWHCSA